MWQHHWLSETDPPLASGHDASTINFAQRRLEVLIATKDLHHMLDEEAELMVQVAEVVDEAAVVDLWCSCGLVVSYNDPFEDFRKAVASASSDILVYKDGSGGILGAVMVGYDGHRGWLYYVAAAPHVQGTGIGRKMVEAAESWLREKGVAKAQLLIRESNTHVVSFYEHLGFEPAPRVVMGKWLK